MKRPLRNILSMLTGEVGSRAVGFLVTVYLARVLAPAAFGVLNIGLSVLGYLMLVVSPGIQVVEARNVAAAGTSDVERVGDVLSVRLALGIAAILCAVLVGVILDVRRETHDVVLLYSLLLFPNALLLDWFFSGKEEMFTLSFSRFLTYVVYAAVVFLSVRTVDDIRWAPIAFFLGMSAAALYLYVMYRRGTGHIELSWNPARWKEILLENLPVGIAFFLAQSVYSLPPLVIGVFRTNADVGTFSAAMKLAFAVLLVDRIFSAMFLPVVARFWSTRKEEVPRLVQVTLRLILALMLPVIGAGYVAAPWVMPLVFGNRYGNAVVPFRIVLLFALCTVVNTIFVCVSIGTGNEKKYSRAIAQGTVVLALSVAAFTAVWGSIGASMGLVLGEAVTLGFMIRSAHGVIELPAMSEYLRPIFSALVMSGVYILAAGLSEELAIVLGLSSFFGLLWILRGFSASDFRYVRERFI